MEIREDPDDHAASAAKYALASGSFGQPDTMRPTQFILKSKVFFSTFIQQRCWEKSSKNATREENSHSLSSTLNNQQNLANIIRGAIIKAAKLVWKLTQDWENGLLLTIIFWKIPNAEIILTFEKRCKPFKNHHDLFSKVILTLFCTMWVLKV